MALSIFLANRLCLPAPLALWRTLRVIKEVTDVLRQPTKIFEEKEPPRQDLVPVALLLLTIRTVGLTFPTLGIILYPI